MTSQKEPKFLIFNENSYSFLKIHGIGYNDFGKNNISDFLTTNVWHALYYVQSGIVAIPILWKLAHSFLLHQMNL